MAAAFRKYPKPATCRLLAVLPGVIPTCQPRAQQLTPQSKAAGHLTPSRALRHLVPIAVHGQQAQKVEGMAALGEAAYSHGTEGLAVSDVTVARHHGQFLHTDDTVLERKQTQGLFANGWASVCQSASSPKMQE